MNKRQRAIKEAIGKLFSQYVTDTEIYYRNKISKGYPLKDIIQESLSMEDNAILRNLIVQEFPQHKNYFCKYLIIQ